MCSVCVCIIQLHQYHIVDIFPIIQRYQLKRCQHGPHEIIEIGEAMVRIFAGAQARMI